MTDDIVTRLRDRAEERQEALDEYWRGHKFDYDFPMLESQAADEIERLRQLTGRLAGLMMPYALLMTKEEQQEVMKVVRGEQN